MKRGKGKSEIFHSSKFEKEVQKRSFLKNYAQNRKMCSVSNKFSKMCEKSVSNKFSKMCEKSVSNKFSIF